LAEEADLAVKSSVALRSAERDGMAVSHDSVLLVPEAQENYLALPHRNKMLLFDAFFEALAAHEEGLELPNDVELVPPGSLEGGWGGMRVGGCSLSFDL
jgi:hypothetical protein